MKHSRSGDLLFIAFHYPPIVGSSGVYRTLSFTRHLSDVGYNVEVLTASTKAYESWSAKQYDLIPEKVVVHRAFCLDVTKHLSIKGKYFSLMAIPDNWQSWILGGVIRGFLVALKRRPKILFSTYPIASAHIIGYILHKAFKIPWIADLRDPMAQRYYPSDKTKKKVFLWIERKIVECSSFAIVTTPGARAFYMERFPETDESFWKILPNGFDDVTFEAVLDELNLESDQPVKQNSKIVILHSGIIYPKERDPSALFKAIASLKSEGSLSSDTVEFRLRSTGHDSIYEKQIAQLNISDIVKLEPTVPYKDAIREMTKVDGFLLMQSEGCNHQIPAKSYEYIKLRKPILGLMPEEGDTGQLIKGLNIAEIAPLNDVEEIKLAITLYIEKLAQNGFELPSNEVVERYSRNHQARELEQLIEQLP